MVKFTFKKLYGFLSKHFKTANKAKDEPLLSEQGLFIDVKQPSDSKIFVSNTIEDQIRIDNYNEIFLFIYLFTLCLMLTNYNLIQK